MILNPVNFEKVLSERCGYRGGGVVAGISGGPDSMCLLHLLASDSRFGKVAALHVHHGIRGAEADRDMEHVRKWCGDLGIPLEIVRRDIPSEAASLGISVEEAGRRARYEELEKLRNEMDYEAIACAHHAGDRAETIMMNIIRGTGTDGLRGIWYRSGRVIRPLLDFTREDIMRYVSEHGIGYVTDSTNMESAYRRNSVRNELLTFISEKYGIDPVEKLNTLGNLAAVDADYIGRQAAEFYEKRALVSREKGREAVLDSAALLEAHTALSARAVRLAVADVKGDIVDLSRDNVAAVLSIAGGTGKRTPLPHGLEAAAYYGRVCIRRASAEAKKTEDTPDVKLSVSLEPYDPSMAGRYRSANRKRPPGKMYFDAERVDAYGQEIVLRHRRDGDRICLENGGTKKLGDWMTDEKIPLEQRDRMWLVACGGMILAAVGRRVFGGFAPCKNSQNVYFLQID